MPDVSNSAEAETNVTTDCRECAKRLIDIGRQNLYAQFSALREVDAELVFRAANAGQQRRHELGRVVCLQVCGPIRDDAIGGAVGAVERIVGERKQRIPESFHGRIGVTVVFHAALKLVVHQIEFIFFLFTHRAAQVVSFSETEPRGLLGGRHYLLLVNNQAIGRVKNFRKRFFEFGMNRFRFLQVVLSKRILRVRLHTHWARSIQRDSR